ncbi:MAG: GMP synthase-like glutamine amidotransferase [Pseudohongiellaceae bacterium]
MLAIDDVVAAIVTGSRAYVTDLAPWNEIAAVYLRLLHEQQKPILGVCYGHQLLTWAFGGVVRFHPNGREIGTIDVELTLEAASDVLFAKMPRQFSAQVMSTYIRESRNDISREGLNVEELLARVDATPVSASSLQQFSALLINEQ